VQSERLHNYEHGVRMRRMPDALRLSTMASQVRWAKFTGAGYTVYLPSLFGRPGEAATTGAIVRSVLRVCVTREFILLADRTSPVASWLRALAAKAHAECGGPGAGAVGMCLTGGFALAMAVEPDVLAPVISQPE